MNASGRCQYRPMYDYDMITIGAGSAGVRASRMAAEFGARVAVIEERELGGTCVNVGCVPKKLLVYASSIYEEMRGAAGFGIDAVTQPVDWARLIANKNREIERLNGVYDRILKKAGVDILEGHATLLDPHTVDIDGKKLTAEYMLVATGGWPHLPSIAGIEHAITSNDVFFLEALPERILIVGGGYIAVEFAGIFNGLGVDTTLVYRKDLFVRGFDCDVRKTLRDEMRKKGVALRFNLNVERIDPSGKGLRSALTDGSVLDTDMVLFATGRSPLTGKLGLENVNVKTLQNGSIVVDKYSKTNVPNIYAVGDVTDRVALTPVAIMEGAAVAHTLFNNRPTAVNHHNVPSAVFSQPPIATVGFTEDAARDQYDSIDVYRSEFSPLKHSLTGIDEKTMIKLIVESATDRVVGIHIVGEYAPEIIQGFAVAMNSGATKAEFDATIGVHPTSAEELVTMRRRPDA